MREKVSESETTKRVPGGRKRTSESPIQSVERASRILGFFVNRPRMSLAEITGQLDVSRATAHRYVVALRRASLLRHEPATGKYTLGPQIVTLASAALAGLPIITLAGPVMERLVEEVNETAVLSVWDGEAPVVVRIEDNTNRLVRIGIKAGARLPTFDSAQGLVFNTFLPPGEPPALPRGSKGGAIRAELARVRKEGVAVNSQVVAGIRAVAAPVFRSGSIVASLAIVGTTASIPEPPDSPVAQALVAAAKMLSAELGFALEEE